MNVAQKCRRKIESTGWHRDLGLPAGRTFRNSLVHQTLDSLQLNRSHDRANVDGFIERRSNTESAHAGTDFFDERLGNTLLHEKTRTGTTELALVEPDSLYQ